MEEILVQLCAGLEGNQSGLQWGRCLKGKKKSDGLRDVSGCIERRNALLTEFGENWSYNWRKLGFPGGPSGKEPTCQCRRHKRLGFNPWVGKIPWRRAQQPTPVFLTGESHGQRSLAGYSLWGLSVGHDWLNGHEFEQTLESGEGQESLAVVRSIGSWRVGHSWVTNTHTLEPMAWILLLSPLL